MRVLFTGASSFTGFWFVQELRRAGHEVICIFQGDSVDRYQELRGWRVRQLVAGGESVFACRFGSPEFLNVVKQGWDLLAHHAADVTNYRSMEFDVVRALGNNTHNLREVLGGLKTSGCRRVLLTGSVFEPSEGAGSDQLPAILPYGLSKGLTAQVFRYEATLAGLHLGKFVIPNPFGAHQEPRFVQYLLSTWERGETAKVGTPDYVRDNISADLLAAEYRRFAESLPDTQGFSRLNPSGIVGTQGDFAERVAKEMRVRFGWDCRLELAHQIEFAEPKIRINTECAQAHHPDWNPDTVWDSLAEEIKA